MSVSKNNKSYKGCVDQRVQYKKADLTQTLGHTNGGMT